MIQKVHPLNTTTRHEALKLKVRRKTLLQIDYTSCFRVRLQVGVPKKTLATAKRVYTLRLDETCPS